MSIQGNEHASIVITGRRQAHHNRRNYRDSRIVSNVKTIESLIDLYSK